MVKKLPDFKKVDCSLLVKTPHHFTSLSLNQNNQTHNFIAQTRKHLLIIYSILHTASRNVCFPLEFFQSEVYKYFSYSPVFLTHDANPTLLDLLQIICYYHRSCVSVIYTRQTSYCKYSFTETKHNIIIIIIVIINNNNNNNNNNNTVLLLSAR